MVGYQGHVIPVIIAVWVLAQIEKRLHKVVPAMFDLFVTPLVSVFVTGYLTLSSIGPIFVAVENGLLDGIQWQTFTIHFATLLIRHFVTFLLNLLRKCVSYHKNPHLSNPFHKTFTHQSAIQHSDDAPAITFTTGNSTFLPAIQRSDDGFHKKLSPSSQPSSAATMAHPSPSGHRKLSLSSQPSSAALMAHPTPVRPLYPSHHDRTV